MRCEIPRALGDVPLPAQPACTAESNRRAILLSVYRFRTGQHVIVVEAIFFIPQPGTMQCVGGIDDSQVMLEEFTRHVAVGRLIHGQFEGHAQHVTTIERHPGSRVGLIEPSAVGQRLVAIENADVIQTQKATAEDVIAMQVFAIDPPGKVQQ